MGKSKYRREYETSKDKLQTRLAPQYERGCTEPMMVTTLAKADPTATYFCPFCLHIGKYTEFLKQTFKGVHKGLAHCPECGNDMKLSTLLDSMTPEQYAEFAYPYAASGFWQKVPFEKWKKRLYELGWSQRFWGRYKQLKGEDEQETPEEHMNRKQKEEYDEYVSEHG